MSEVSKTNSLRVNTLSESAPNSFGLLVKNWFDRAVDIVFGLILVFIMIGIGYGSIQLFASLWKLFATSGITGKYIYFIADVLTLYVLIELARALVEYFYSHKLRLTFIIDAGIVFVLREVLIMMFKHELQPQMIYALSVLLLVLGGLRIGSILVYQKEKQLSD